MQLEKSSFDNVSILEFTVLNSIGVNQKIAKKCSSAISKLAARNNALIIKANYGLVKGDGFQQLGETSILSNISPNLAEVNLMKVDIGWQRSLLLCGPATYYSHFYHHFTVAKDKSTGKKSNFRLYTNLNGTDRNTLSTELNTKSNWMYTVLKLASTLYELNFLTRMTNTCKKVRAKAMEKIL